MVEPLKEHNDEGEKIKYEFCFVYSFQNSGFLKSHGRLQSSFQLGDTESKVSQSPLHLFSIIEMYSPQAVRVSQNCLRPGDHNENILQ